MEEAKRADEGILTPDCREGACSKCGACPGPEPAVASGRDRSEGAGERAVPGEAGEPVGSTSRYSPRPKRPAPSMRLRIKYAKTEELRFASHLDLTRVFQRSIRRARLPVAYSEGFSPHPRVSFGPPLPLGVAGDGEYLDVSIEAKPREGWLERLNSTFPPGVRALDARMIPAQGPSLISLLNAAKYKIVVWDCDPQAGSMILESLKQAFGAYLLEAAPGERDGACEILLTARLKLDSGASEKVIERVLRQTGKSFQLERTGLYIEREGVLYSPFGEMEKG